MKKDKELIQCYSSEIVDAANQNGESCEPFSLLEGEESFFSRILSRDTSLGMSSRVYSRGEARVPFEWELQPGKPKVVEQNITCDLLPTLSPPPVALFSYLSPGRSRWEKMVLKDADTARSNKFQWFWKRAGRRRQRASALRTDTDSETGSEYYSSFDRRAFVSSPTSSNASSSSASSTSGSSLVYSRIKDAQVHGISLRWVRRLCTAWHSGAFVSRTNRR